MHVPHDVVQLCRKLRQAKFRAWIVGGCTRDSLLNREVKDWDVATNARPDQVAAVFPRVIPTGLAHGTVTVRIGKNSYEVTTLRGEGTYSDGRHPDQVTFVNELEQDLGRRDFTINAIGYDPIEKQWIDPYHGRKDLSQRLIRAVGVASQRFHEDGLRLLRAARFVSTLEFDLEPQTRAAMAESADRLCCVSYERIRDELIKTLMSACPSLGLDVMMQVGIMQHVIPQAVAMVGCEQNRYHIFDVWRHTLQAVDAVAELNGRAELRMAMLLHDIGKPEVRTINEKTNDYAFWGHEVIGAKIADSILQHLCFSNAQRTQIVHLIRHHVIAYDGNWTDSAIRRWIRRVGDNQVEDLVLMARADATAKGHDPKPWLMYIDELLHRVQRLRQQGIALSLRDLAINGTDLMEQLELDRGRIIGQILEYLLQIVLQEPSLNERTLLLDAARKYVNRHENRPLT